MIHASRKLWFEDDDCLTYRQYKTRECFNQGSPSTLMTEQVLGMYKPEPWFNRALKKGRKEHLLDVQPCFPKSEVFVSTLAPLASAQVLAFPWRWCCLMNYDRPGPAISAPGSGNQFQTAEGTRVAVSVFIIWFVIWLDSCYSNHCSNHRAGHDPCCKSFNDHSGILIIVGTKRPQKVHPCRTTALSAVPPELLHHSSAYQSPPPTPCSTKIYLPPPRQCLGIRGLTMCPRLQLFSGGRASRAPVNHRLLYLGHSKSSCVMPCYLGSNNCSPPKPTCFLSNPDSSLPPPLALPVITPFSKSLHSYFSFLVMAQCMIGHFHPGCMGRKRNVIV